MNPEQSVDERLPVYPEGIIPPSANDPPKFDGDLSDMSLRMRTKLYNVWTLYSDLRKNGTLANYLNKDSKDKETKYVKACLVITIDRLAKMLIDTNLTEELAPAVYSDLQKASLVD
jgi:hypothetical protein